MSQFRRIVVLTGAGISAESGLSTFRDGGGLWDNHRIDEVATPEAFDLNPDLVQRFYNQRRRAATKAQPNAAHLCLAQVEPQCEHWTLVSQNVDDLHQRAGSQHVLSMHGQLDQYLCVNCHKEGNITGELSTQDVCPHCHKVATLRPRIVWFGEMPLYLDDIMTNLMACDLFVAIGTSGTVYPAAGFVEIAKRNKAHTVMLNLDGTDNLLFDKTITGQASQIVPAYFYDELGFKR